MKNSSSKQILLSVLAVAILVVAVVGISFAAFTFAQAGEKENTISSGTIAMAYTEGTNGISIEEAMPMSDEAGKLLSKDNEQFKFTVGATITGTANVSYEIVAVKDESSTIADENIRLYLEKAAAADGTYEQTFAPAKFTPSENASSLGAPAGSMLLESGSFTETKTNYYLLRMWLAENAPINGDVQTYKVKVNVYGKA